MSLVAKAVKSPDKVARKLKRITQHTAEDAYRWLFQRSTWSTVINEQEIRIIGMRRTGNHAIFEWMKAQAEGTHRALNNLEVRVNPYRYKYEMLRDHYPQYTWSIEQYRPLAKGQLTPIDWFFYNYEDHDLKQIISPSFEHKHDLYVGKSHKRIDLLILRDPFNLFASRLKSDMMAVKNPHRNVVDIWIEYAKEFLGETQHLKHNKICVSYNQWFQSRDYREHLAQQLGLTFTDAGLDTVGGWGGGSSFEGRELSGKAQSMAVLDRWQTYAKDPEYRKLFNNDSLLTYAEKIFGQLPGTEILTKSQTTPLSC